MVDQWKFKVYEDTKHMTPGERAAYWRNGHDLAHEMGVPLTDVKLPIQKPKKKRRPRKTG